MWSTTSDACLIGCTSTSLSVHYHDQYWICFFYDFYQCHNLCRMVRLLKYRLRYLSLPCHLQTCSQCAMIIENTTKLLSTNPTDPTLLVQILIRSLVGVHYQRVECSLHHDCCPGKPQRGTIMLILSHVLLLLSPIHSNTLIHAGWQAHRLDIDGDDGAASI